jgi:hypothetical protein
MLCLSGTFRVENLSPIQAQTQDTTNPPSVEELNVKMAQVSSSNKPEETV